MRLFIQYLFKAKWIQIIIVIILIGTAIFFKLTKYSIRTIYEDLFAPSVGIITIALAIFIWYNDNRREWMNSLPKLLTVAFVYKNEIIMLCRNAGLAHESDIRNWSQQIGRQMTDNEPLGIELSIKQHISQKPSKLMNRKYVNYYSYIYLSRLPKKLESHNSINKSDNNIKKAYIWSFDFDNNNFKRFWAKLNEPLLEIHKAGEIVFSEIEEEKLN